MVRAVGTSEHESLGGLRALVHLFSWLDSRIAGYEDILFNTQSSGRDFLNSPLCGGKYLVLDVWEELHHNLGEGGLRLGFRF